MVLQGKKRSAGMAPFSGKIDNSFSVDLAAVREDRMPGGRNSGAVYNLYKVKYKKHKKTAQKSSPQQVSTYIRFGD